MKIFGKVCLVLMLVFAFQGNAQDVDKENINKLTKKADDLFKTSMYAQANVEYKKALSKTKDKAEKAKITFRLGYCEYKMRDYKKAISYLTKTTKYKYADTEPIVYYLLAESYKRLGEYEDALTQFNLYKEKVPSDKRGANGAKSCELSIAWMNEPTRYKVTNMAVFNSNQDDVAPTFGDKRHKTIIFSSKRDGSTGNGTSEIDAQSFNDLYLSEIDRKGKWSKPVNESFAGTVNSKDFEGAATFDKRYKTIYFTRCEVPKKNGEAYCNIYMAKKMGKGYEENPVKALKLDSAVIGHPSISEDGNTIYFAANLEGGYGGMDIWKMEYDKKAKEFVNLVNLGPQVNTSGNETYPFIHQDGTLYFSSNGHIGMGGFDIFKVEADGSGWGPVVNMKSPINSEGDDVSIIFEDEKERGYFASSRKGSKGSSLDIYSFVLPKLEFMVTGVVKDAVTGEILPGSSVKLVASDGETLEATADDAGAYEFTLKPNTSYTLAARSDAKKKNGKLAYFASKPAMLTTAGEMDSKTFNQDFNLEPIPDAKIVLPNILYALNDTALLPESKVALRSLVDMLNENPNLAIKLMSHTDFRGSDAANMKLSRGRANSVVHFLVENGIDKDRLTYEGKGESEPRAITEKNKADFEKICKDKGVKMNDYFKVGDVMTEAYINKLGNNNAKEVAHQFNRRTEFDITSDTYVPKGKVEGGDAGAEEN